MRKREELEKREQNERKIRNDIPDIHIDDEGLVFLQQAREEIHAWMNGHPTHQGYDYINIATKNGYYKRILHQIIRSEYPQLQTDSRHTFVQIRYKSGNEELDARRMESLRGRFEVSILQ